MKDALLYRFLPHPSLNTLLNDRLMDGHGTTIKASNETFIIFNNKYGMHFLWQNVTLTFFLALVALKSRIMAVKGMQATLHGAVYKL